MGYNTTGLSHSNGLKGEKVVAEMLGTNTLLRSYLGGDSSVVKRGGTQYKEDIAFTRDPSSDFLGISVKNRGGKTGTFDWVNLTKVFSDMPSLSTALRPAIEYFNSVKGVYQDSPLTKSANREEVKSLVKPYRAEYNRIVNGCLDDITPAMLKTILSQTFEKYTQEDEFYVAVHYPKKKSVWFEFNKDLPLVGLLNDPNVSFFLKKNRHASQRIWCKMPDGSTHDTYLRLRVALNNGMSVHLAGSKWSDGTNNGSCITVKIQQDQPEKFLENIKNRREFVV